MDDRRGELRLRRFEVAIAGIRLSAALARRCVKVAFRRSGTKTWGVRMLAVRRVMSIQRTIKKRLKTLPEENGRHERELGRYQRMKG